ncbi:class I SAM-dependent methyltransferase [Aestuariivivens insulae]|uniref:class I SAM-dependent methyltransferase n=1 Tax=Aestuariivivens insulae TaxID=1621988 RepID=UPI001F57F768|nr:class I SAM-dependent methyltransferase [Aestuariivivens insulae]
MSKKVDHYGPQYSNFVTNLYKEIRQETYGSDIGQNGWITQEEQDLFIEWLSLDKEDVLLDVACGSGGPTLRLAERMGCFITGVDIHEDGIKAAKKQAKEKDLTSQSKFMVIDASGKLPFENASFDAVMCIDAINHLPNRLQVLNEWNRVLKSNGKLLFTDPITVTGSLSKEDIEIRSSIGYFLFVADGVDEKLLSESGFNIVHKVDRTENMAQMALKWRNARANKADLLIKAEGKEVFEGQQQFFEVCARLGAHKDLSRFAFYATKK